MSFKVQHRPGQGIIEATQTIIEVGGRTTLTCNAADRGSPPAEYRWATPKAGGAYSDYNSSVLEVDHATLTDNGEYRCMPHNIIGNGIEGVIVLQVILHYTYYLYL